MDRLNLVSGIVLGIAIGTLPLFVKISRMDKDASAAAKEIADLRQALTTQTARADEETKAHELMTHGWLDSVKGDGSVTVLVDVNHPYGGGNLMVNGSTFTLPARTANVNVGPIWVIPRRVTPQIVDGVLAGSYMHVTADGKSDGWHSASMAGGKQ